MIIGMSCFLHKKTIYHKQQKIHDSYEGKWGDCLSRTLVIHDY